MSHNPTVSVIIPAYNAADYVGRAIESALNQTHAPLEVIVIDDGSRDNTAEQVAQYPAPVRLLRQPNGGPAAARNHGARVANGEWLALLDADDAWLPHKLERQLPYLSEPTIALVHACEPAEYAPREATFEALWKRNFLLTSSVLIRRTAFDETGRFNEDRELIGVEDYNLWLRMAARGLRVIGHPELLHEYTPAPGHLTSQSERFARAELANLEAIRCALDLDPEMVRDKQMAIYETYGRQLFHYRQLGAARRLLGKLLLQRPSPARLVWWLATFIPPAVLDGRRQFAEQT